jgi:hypothetical protein
VLYSLPDIFVVPAREMWVRAARNSPPEFSAISTICGAARGAACVLLASLEQSLGYYVLLCVKVVACLPFSSDRLLERPRFLEDTRLSA